MPTLSNKAKIARAVSEYGKMAKSGRESLLAAARVYAKAVSDFGQKAEEAFRKAYPSTSRKTWDMFRRIGNGDLVVTALMCPSDYVISVVSTLPFSVQETLFGGLETEPVKQDVFIQGRVCTKYAMEMSGPEIVSLVDTKARRLRTVEEQKALHPPTLTATVKSRADIIGPYTVEGGVLVVARSCIIGKNELASIAKSVGLMP